jgi:hypothetical protein
MLYRRRIQRCADTLQHRVALVAQIAEHAHLDQLVREQIHVELVQHRRREPVMSDAYDRMQVMRLGAQRSTPGWG